jgi:hypothetical protein
MPTFMIREFVDGKMIGHPVEAETAEEAAARFAEELPELLAKEAEAKGKALLAASVASQIEGRPQPARNPALDGRKFINIEFQCAACLEPLQAEFRDGYLQIAPCPTCLGELENMVAASRRFLDRKK